MHVLRPIAGLAAAWLFTVAAAQPLILRPEPGQVVHSNAGQVVVVVTGVPRGAHVVPVLDGRALGDPRRGPVVQLRGVDRGTHTLEVMVVGGEADGARTPPVTFHLFQASRLFPQRRVP